MDAAATTVRVVPMVPGMRIRKRGDDDSASTENDSMRPLAEPRRKKRRTILDAFNSINLKQEAERQQFDDADSSQAVAEDDVGYSTTSSLEDDEESQEALMSDVDKNRKDVERKVMYELVFGPESSFVPPKNPVDRKLEQLLQTTAVQHQSGSATLDDMSLSTPYNSGSSDLGAQQPSGSSSGGFGGLKRSNSLPEIYSKMESVCEEMDMG